MIYTVTTNPNIDYYMDLRAPLRVGGINRSGRELLAPGGKGINVSLMLQTLGKPSCVLGYLAGPTGRLLEALMKDTGCDCHWFWLQSGQTRINTKINTSPETAFNASGPALGQADIDALCAFLLLKHREMERSGDVIAVGWLRPVALYVFTIGCALVLGALMAELFSSQTADNFWYVLLFLFVGAFVGYFVGKMLLQKTIHVFRSGWLGLGICCLALLLAFGAAEFDLFGYSRYLPERGAVQAAGLTHYQSSGLYTTQDDVFVQDVLALHAAAIAEKGAQEHRRHAYQLGADYTEQFYITYRMADGTLTERYYSIVYNDAELKDPDSLISRFSALYNSPVCVRIRAGFDTPRTEKSVLSCYVSSYDTGADLELTGSDAWRVYEACLDDINAGLLGAADVSGSTKQSDGSNYTPLTLIFTVSTDVPGQTDSLYVDSIPLSAAETVSALQALGADPYWRAAG